MRRTLLLSLLVVGAAAALAIGSYSALAGAGPVTGVAGAVIGADEPDDGDVAGDADDDVDDVDAGDEEDGNGVGNGAEKVVQALADEFGGSAEDMLSMHEQGVGFGAMFKLYALAAAMGTSVDDLMATNGNGEYEFGFGELRKDLDEDQTAALEAILESGPKNLGQLVSAAHHEDNGGAGGVTAQGGGRGHAFGRDHDQGKPQGVPPDSDGE